MRKVCTVREKYWDIGFAKQLSTHYYYYYSLYTMTCSYLWFLMGKHPTLTKNEHKKYQGLP